MYRTFCILLSFCGCRFHARQIIIYMPILMKTELTCSFSSRFLQWKDVTEEKYVITPSIPDAAIIVTSPTESRLKLSIHLTSPVIREQVEKEASGGMISIFFFFGPKRPSEHRRSENKGPAASNEWWFLLGQILGAFSILNVASIVVAIVQHFTVERWDFRTSPLKRHEGFALQQKWTTRLIYFDVLVIMLILCTMIRVYFLTVSDHCI